MLVASFGLICLAQKTASAEDDVYRGYKPHIVPECKVYKVNQHLEVCGYATIEEVRALYEADAELYGTRKKMFSVDLKLKVQEEQIADLRIAVGEFKEAIAVVDARNAKLTKELIETDRKYQNERVKPKWGNPLAWGSTAVLGALLVGFVGHSVLVE